MDWNALFTTLNQKFVHGAGYLGQGVGLVFGGALVLVIYGSIWVFFAGIVQEWFEEQVVDPYRRKRSPLVPTPSPTDSTPSISGYRILVSDLHIDTWDDAIRTKFRAFLDAIEAEPRITEVHLNGDLMDMPLHPANAGEYEPVILEISAEFNHAMTVSATQKDLVVDMPRPWQGELTDEVSLVLGWLAGMTSSRRNLRAFYFTGNHDMGIGGLRFFRPDYLQYPVQAVWNPSGLIFPSSQDPANPDDAPVRPKAIYLEHGHLHDPFMWLYLRYATLDLLRGGQAPWSGSTMSIQQRGGKAGMDTGTTANSLLVRYRYRHAARRAYNNLRKWVPDIEVTAIFMGHTHMPECCELFGKGGKFTYINSGTWTRGSDHTTYCIIRPDGTVLGPLDWQNGVPLHL